MGTEGSPSPRPLNSLTANPTTRPCTRRAFFATSPAKIATLFLPVTRLNFEEQNNKENACPQSTCTRQPPRRPISTSPGSPISGQAARSSLATALTSTSKCIAGARQKPTSRKAPAASGTSALRLVRSQPRRPHNHRFPHLGRRVGPHLHFQAPVRRPDRH